jgi:hypothetical protein
MDKLPELIIGDPHDQPGLVDRIPDGVGPVQIVNFYHYHLYPHEKAYCAKCQARRHRDGFTVELENGSFALAGSTCGSDLWGERWSVVRQDFQTRLHKAGIILDAREALSELEAIREELETSWAPIVRQVHAVQNQFRGSMPQLYGALRSAAMRSDHCLIWHGEPQYLEGWAFFATEEMPRRFRLALDQIQVAIAAAQGTATELGVRTANIREARQELDAIAHAARALRSFFTPKESSHLRYIVETANCSLPVTDQRYRAGNRSVVDTITGHEIRLPRDYPVINAEPLRKLNDLR